MRGELLLKSTESGERLQLAGAGAWTAENAGILEPLIDAEAGARRREIKSVTIDMAAVQQLDTFGA